MLWALLLASVVRAADVAVPLAPLPQAAALPLLPTLPALSAAALPAVALPEALATPLPEALGLRTLVAGLQDPHGPAPETLLAGFWDAPRGRRGVASVAAAFEVAASKPAGARLAEIAQAAHASPTARRVLRAYAEHARKTGAVPVRFKALGTDHGRYDYTKGVLTLDARYRDGPAVEAAPTLIHELMHILQHAQGIPAESLEMELEAHAVTLAVMSELGLKAGGEKDFSRAALEKLRESPKAYIAWMAEQLSGKYLLIGSDLATVKDDLESEIAELEVKDGPRAAERLRWAESDLEILNSKAGAARYRAYAARVASLLRKYHKAAAGWDL